MPERASGADTRSSNSNMHDALMGLSESVTRTASTMNQLSSQHKVTSRQIDSLDSQMQVQRHELQELHQQISELRSLHVSAQLPRPQQNIETFQQLLEDQMQRHMANSRLEVEASSNRMDLFEQRLQHLEETSGRQATVVSPVDKQSPFEEGQFEDEGNPDVKMEVGHVTTESLRSATSLFEMEHAIGGSVWNAPIFAFLQGQVENLASFTLCFVSMVNACLQLFLCWILRKEDEFNLRQEQYLPILRDWRVTDGHQYQEVGAMGKSLVRRVCEIDMTLSTASGQIEAVAGINNYLSLSLFEMDAPALGSGPVLCMVCILVFSMSVIHEVREALEFSRCLSLLPRVHTRIVNHELISLTRHRLAACFVLSVTRIGIATQLLISGIMWLSATSSRVNLILNAAALGFVMDIDELMFSCLMPDQLIQLVTQMQPLKFPKTPCFIDGSMPLAVLITIAILAWFQGVAPNIRDMVDLKRVMCDGNLDFVVQHRDDLNMIMSRSTPNSTEFDSFLGAAVKELIDSQSASLEVWAHNLRYPEKTPQLSTYYGPDKATFDAFLKYNLDDYTDMFNAACRDWNWDMYSGAGAWFASVRDTNNAFQSALANTPFQCSDFRKHCSEAKNQVLRLICPVTCGCPDPRSGLYLASAWGGCPESCAAKHADALKAAQCVDTDIGKPDLKAAWNRYWQGWKDFEHRVSRSWWGAQEDAFFERVTTNGCAEILTLPNSSYTASGWDACDQTPSMYKLGKSPVLGLCPATCCPEGNEFETCPTMCKGRDEAAKEEAEQEAEGEGES